MMQNIGKNAWCEIFVAFQAPYCNAQKSAESACQSAGNFVIVVFAPHSVGRFSGSACFYAALRIVIMTKFFFFYFYFSFSSRQAGNCGQLM
ncbi:hypothetical protein V8J88_14745 [Massilia sp. W12]|uniref:hypothetical protein n=1 Tax=Massilia sp. W12 TaxID=3126507 RepID=UPI0030CB79A0